MTTVRILTVAAACTFATSCSNLDKGEENYDTVDGSGYDTSNPYGVPGEASAEAVPYQPVNPPADNPTYGQAAYEETAAAPAYTPDTTAAPSPALSGASTSHTVVRGDTLGGIARRYGVSTASIKQANGMTSDVVVLGKSLTIPGASGPATAPARAGGRTHLVSRGDSLSRIASKYGTTADAIRKANGMKSDTVVLGTRLRIP